MTHLLDKQFALLALRALISQDDQLRATLARVRAAHEEVRKANAGTNRVKPGPDYTRAIRRRDQARQLRASADLELAKAILDLLDSPPEESHAEITLPS